MTGKAVRETMTPKQRWLAAIGMEPVDRLPFWPKLNEAYPRMRAAPFCDMTVDAVHDWIGSDKHTWIAGCTRDVRKATSIRTAQANGTRRKVYQTPHGRMELVCRYDGPSDSWHPVTFPVQDVEDVRLMTEVYADVTVELDAEGLARARARSDEIGQDAVTANGVGESPLMQLVEWLAGIETAHYLLADHRRDVEGLFAAIDGVLKRRTELLCKYSPADVLYMVENTSTTLISPTQYRRYCMPQVGAYAELAATAGRNMVLHMCGHLKALLGDLSQIRARAFEAFTSPTLGNTTLLDGRRGCPDKCLIGGTNATLWTRSADEIIAQIEHDLDELPHHRGIVVTSAGVMPPMCEPETIRQVCRWVKDYPARTNGRH